MREPYRPQYHFSPPRNWMNDPNGLVYHEGEYHLFYQHNPTAAVHAGVRPMHWGHAISTDLVHWTHHPIALKPDQLGDIWSGCAVVDRDDSSALFDGKAGLVAVFTQNLDGLQQQSIASSVDKGRTWTMYPGNPVLPNPGLADMRDPKVFWHATTRRWIMILACGDHTRLYASQNLITWDQIGSFGQDQGSHSGVWECPDLFPLSIDANPASERWVLTVSVNSRIQYFVGRFTGEAFVNENDAETVLWADHGRDNYAAVTWSEAPLQAGQRVWVGWMADPVYAGRTPTDSWRGSLTLPRLLALRRTSQGLRMTQRPVPALQSLRGQARHWDRTTVTPGTNLLAGMTGRALEIVGRFTLTAPAELGFRVRAHGEHQTTVGYVSASSTLFVDRTKSGLSSFSPVFAGRQEAPLPMVGGAIELRIFVDWSSIEVFGNDGDVIITDLIFPDAEDVGMEFYASGDSVVLNSLDIYSINSVWNHESGPAADSEVEGEILAANK